MRSAKANASGKGGANVTELGGGVTEKAYIFRCSSQHITKVCRLLQAAGVGLKSVGTDTQCLTLLRALQFLGPQGLNTYEGTAAGYARLATRIQELEADGWLIDSHRESVIGPDGLFHPGIARYVLVGKRSEIQACQMDLALEVA